MSTIDLNLACTVAALPAEVYGVWLDANNPGSPWFGVHQATVNPVVGGLFYHAVNYQGHEWAHYGRFITLDAPHKIQHTWVSEATRGLESVLTLTFEEADGQTFLRLLHSNLPDDEMGRRHAQGWEYVLGAIVERFAKTH